MYESDRSANETVTSEYGTTAPSADRANEANGSKAPRKVLLAATATCPACGFANKPEWLNKSHNSDSSYAATLSCKQCGSLLAVWAMQVDVQVLTENPGYGHTTSHPDRAS
jgi:DNA-directed RNA polymerase subunit M/transcription elongation factor TFIIS